jgi:ketosteroid isomerase-like protein
MSRENVEVVQQVWAAWDRGDVTALLEALSDEVVTTAVGLDGAEHRGKEGYLDLLADWNERFTDLSATAEEFIEAGDQVVVRNRQVARGETSGAPVESEFWFVYTLSAGKIVRQDYYTDRAEALEAVGLSE